MDDDPWRNPFAEPESGAEQDIVITNDLKPSTAISDWGLTASVLDLHAGQSSLESPSWEPSPIADEGMGGWASSALLETPAWGCERPEKPSWQSSSPDPRAEDAELQNLEKDVQTTPSTHDLDRPDWKSESSVETINVEEKTPSELSEPALKAELDDTPSTDNPDAFGGFESGSFGEIDVDNAWRTAEMVDDQAWSSAWSGGPPISQSDEKESVKDEWDVALEMKRQRESIVPRERLDEWISSIQTNISEVWPSPKDGQSSDDCSWRISMDPDGKIARLLETVPSEMQLPRLPHFHQTKLYASQAKALKLTRNLPLSLRSPLSLLQISKGSASWEKSVRQDPKRESDDWDWPPNPVPSSSAARQEGQMGSATAPKEQPNYGEKRTIRSSIMSFLSSKTASLASTASTSSSIGTEAFPKTPPALSPVSNEPAQASLETQSKPSESKEDVIEVTSSALPQADSDQLPHKSKDSIRSLFKNADTSVVAVEDDEHTVEGPATHSVVSRFLNRITRGRSSASENAALSLSNSDLSYLEEVNGTTQGSDTAGFDDSIFEKPSIPDPPQGTKPQPIVPTSFLPSSQELYRQRAVADAIFSRPSRTSSISSTDIWDLPIASSHTPVSPQSSPRNSFSSQPPLISPTPKPAMTGLPRPQSKTPSLRRSVKSTPPPAQSSSPTSTAPALPAPPRTITPIQRPPLNASPDHPILSLASPTKRAVRVETPLIEDDFDDFISSPSDHTPHCLTMRSIPLAARIVPPRSSTPPKQIQSAMQKSPLSLSTSSKAPSTLNFDFLSAFGGSSSSRGTTPTIGPPSRTSTPGQKLGFSPTQQPLPVKRSSVVDSKTGLSAQDLSFFEGL
ncbi:uncharacterized protein EI90DRAFT_3062803 [Cantharellus anzutake]|uniref:uncharacterized protein n=1 Tax=Cantharellus anzutake TaxID=1750568 RepID=UPI001908CE07|nr:uncharacterized protein EI90DRAFT_3062803 [Cantharellus anzutake]KAF8329489.1 hypothetical protein EI90DRAFT_3062803 [Cantharellus anzutake]